MKLSSGSAIIGVCSLSWFVIDAKRERSGRVRGEKGKAHKDVPL